MVTIWQRIGRYRMTAWELNLLAVILVLCASLFADPIFQSLDLATGASMVLFVLLLVPGVCIDIVCLVLTRGIKRFAAVLILVIYAAMVLPVIAWW